MKKWLVTPLNDLTIWVNLIIATGIVLAINSAMLSEMAYNYVNVNVAGDSIMFLTLFILVVITITLYNLTPPPPV